MKYGFSLLPTLVSLCGQVCPEAAPLVDLASGYDMNVPPKASEPGRPLLVNISVYLGSILDVDEPKQMISIEAIVRVYWNDSRLNISLPENDTVGYVLRTRDPLKDLWFPDIFLDHTKELRKPSYEIPPSYLRLYPGGRLVYSSMVNFDMDCPMDFRQYPVDTQTCDMIIESYGTTTDVMTFQWLHKSTAANIQLNQHELQVNFLERTNAQYVTGTFPSLVVRIKLTRNLNFHVLRTYIPSALFVSLAWISLFIPLGLLPGRVGLGITTLLTLASMYGSLNSITPPISYTTKLDIWIIGCILFVCTTLFETGAVVYLKYHRLQYGNKTKDTAVDHTVVKRTKYFEKVSPAGLDKRRQKEGAMEDMSPQEIDQLTIRVDKVCAMLALIVAALFCLGYWIDLLVFVQ